MKHKLFIERQDDRDAAVQILARNGYTVRAGREKAKTGSKYLHYIEYWGTDDA